jgi:hypothetical protein
MKNRLRLLTFALVLGLVAALPAVPTTVKAGEPIGGSFNISNQTVYAIGPAVAYNPDREEYLVVWTNDRPGNDDIQAQRVSKAGRLVGPAFYISGGAGVERSHPDVTYNSQRGEYLVVWEHNPSAPEIHARPVAGLGGVTGSEETIASAGPIAPYHPVVAYASTSDKYLVVWYEEGGGFTHVWGQVLHSDGSLSGSDFVISKDPGTQPRINPDVAYNRSRNEYLVVWQQLDPTSMNPDYDIYGRRVQGNGTPLFPQSIEIRRAGGDQSSPAVAGIPTEPGQGQYLVVMEDWTDDIIGQRVKGDGTIEGYDLDLSKTADSIAHPAVAGDEHAQEYLVVWAKTPYQPGVPGSCILGRQVSSTGAFLGPETVIGGRYAYTPAVASGPVGDFLVAFDDSDGTSTYDIFGRLWGHRVYLPLVLRN